MRTGTFARGCRVLALTAALAGSAAADPAGSADDLKSAVRKLSEAASYTWSVESSAAGDTAEKYAAGPLDGKTEKGGFTWIRTRETPPIEIGLKAQKMVVRLDEGWALEQDLASGARLRPHANLTLVRSLKTHPRPAAQAALLLKHSKDLKEGVPGYFTATLEEAGVKELLRQSIRMGRNPEVTPKDGTVAFTTRDGVVVRYEYSLHGDVSYPAPAASTWTAELRSTVDIKEIGTTSVELPEEARKKLE